MINSDFAVGLKLLQLFYANVPVTWKRDLTRELRLYRRVSCVEATSGDFGGNAHRGTR